MSRATSQHAVSDALIQINFLWTENADASRMVAYDLAPQRPSCPSHIRDMCKRQSKPLPPTSASNPKQPA